MQRNALNFALNALNFVFAVKFLRKKHLKFCKKILNIIVYQKKKKKVFNWYKKFKGDK